MFARHRFGRSLAAAVLALGLSAPVAPASAEEAAEPAPPSVPGDGASEAPQAPEAAAAEALFREGKRLMAAGRWSEACALLDESQRLDPGSGTLLNLAICRESEGRLATAWAHYRSALADARRMGHDARRTFIEQRLVELEAKVPWVTIEVPGAVRVAGFAVTLGGLALREPSFGVAIAVDPGELEIRCEAPGRRATVSRVSVAVGERRTFRGAPLPPLSDESPVEQEHGPRRPATEVAGLVLVGVGLVGLGVGVGFGVDAGLAGQQADDLCPTTCSSAADEAEWIALADRAQASAVAADWAVALGAGLTAGGVALIVLGKRADRRRSAAPGAPSLRLAPSAAPAGVALAGRF